MIAEQQATIAELRALVAEMRAMLEEMRTAHAAREAELQGKLEALQRKVFGKKAEKMPSPRDALRKKDGRKADPHETARRRAASQAQKDALTTELVPHRVTDEARTCAECAGVELEAQEPKVRIDYEYVPGYFRRYVREQEVLACLCCKARVVGTVRPRPFEKSPYGPGLVAHVVVQK
ncbi:MAG: hypothetical protein RL385_4941, partial [Pseudomonadota bacterium]